MKESNLLVPVKNYSLLSSFQLEPLSGYNWGHPDDYMRPSPADISV